MPRLPLTVDDHSRDSAGLRYVYPVLSRRANGVSVGINLNPNNACNWRCIYCQVPDLVRGGPPPLDLGLLERELAGFLDQVTRGDFSWQGAAAGRRLVDVAFSGNGEPTSAREFPAAVAVVCRLLEQRQLARTVPVRLITNGSLLDRRAVQAGIADIGRADGEVWFKVDAATAAGLARINGTRSDPDRVARRLETCAGLARTWVQTCVFRHDGNQPATAECHAYIELLRPLARRLAGVHLYGLARPSMQPEAQRLSRLDSEWLEGFARRLRGLGFEVRVSP
jgi:wyosine [tRNA(Phe)-imidazoG37] synthetase (radical SAM superfamily)